MRGLNSRRMALLPPAVGPSNANTGENSSSRADFRNRLKLFGCFDYVVKVRQTKQTSLINYFFFWFFW